MEKQLLRRRTLIIREEALDGTIVETAFEVDLEKPSSFRPNNSAQSLADPTAPYSQRVTMRFFHTVTPSSWKEKIEFFRRVDLTNPPEG